MRFSRVLTSKRVSFLAPLVVIALLISLICSYSLGTTFFEVTAQLMTQTSIPASGVVNYVQKITDLKTCQRIDRNGGAGTLTQSELRDIARNFDSWITHWPDLSDVGHSYAEILKDENPDIFTGFYLDVSYLSDSWGSEELLALEKDYWFLKDENGNILRNNWLPSLRVLDIGHSEVQQAFANFVKQHFDRYAYDFVFVDDFSISLNIFRWGATDSIPVNPRTGSLYTDEEWYNDMLEFLRAMKTTIGSKKVIGNTYWDLILYTDKIVYDEIDGFYWEDTRIRPEGEIDKLLAVAQQMTEEGKIWVYGGAISDERPQEQMSMYRLCFYLLHHDPNNHCYAILRGNEEYPNQYKGQLGQPLGDYQKIAGTSVYTRQFEKSWVLLNASPDSYTVTIDGTNFVVEGYSGQIIPT